MGVVCYALTHPAPMLPRIPSGHLHMPFKKQKAARGRLSTDVLILGLTRSESSSPASSDASEPLIPQLAEHALHDFQVSLHVGDDVDIVLFIDERHSSRTPYQQLSGHPVPRKAFEIDARSQVSRGRESETRARSEMLPQVEAPLFDHLTTSDEAIEPLYRIDAPLRERDIRYMDRLSIEIRPLIVRGIKTSEIMEVDDRCDRTTTANTGYLRSPQRKTVHEVDGPIDRVHYEAIVAHDAIGTNLFADYGEIRKVPRESIGYDLIGRDISIGHDALYPIRVLLPRGQSIPSCRNDLAGFLGRLDHRVENRFVMIHARISHSFVMVHARISPSYEETVRGVIPQITAARATLS